jgi:pimeloyl-ACP methyl ester carboxylesterase
VIPTAPLLLIHGLHGTASEWGPLTAHLASQGPQRLILTPDLPGFGGSPRQGDHTLSAVVAHLAEQVGESGPLDIVGHGWGGTLALAFAATHPASVRRLVDISGAWPPWLAAGPDHPAPGMTRSHRLTELLAGSPSQRSVRQDYLRVGAGIGGAPKPARSLVLWGAGDRWLRPRFGEKVVSSLGRYTDPTTIEMVTLPGVGHAPHLTAPDAVGPLLCEFLHGS